MFHKKSPAVKAGHKSDAAEVRPQASGGIRLLKLGHGTRKKPVGLSSGKKADANAVIWGAEPSSSPRGFVDEAHQSEPVFHPV